MTSYLHNNVIVRGRVQGVFFRASTRTKAEELGLFGFVHNEEDGSVYIEVEGEQIKIDELLLWLRNGGPSHASVDDIQINQGELVNFIGFEIR